MTTPPIPAIFKGKLKMCYTDGPILQARAFASQIQEEDEMCHVGDPNLVNIRKSAPVPWKSWSWEHNNGASASMTLINDHTSKTKNPDIFKSDSTYVAISHHNIKSVKRAIEYKPDHGTCKEIRTPKSSTEVVNIEAATWDPEHEIKRSFLPPSSWDAGAEHCVNEVIDNVWKSVTSDNVKGIEDPTAPRRRWSHGMVRDHTMPLITLNCAGNAASSTAEVVPFPIADLMDDVAGGMASVLVAPSTI
jgi:hypothetical protein